MLTTDHVNFADPPLKRQNANYARTHELPFCTFWREFEMVLSLLKREGGVYLGTA